MLAPHLIRQLAGVAEHDGRYFVLHGLQLLQHRQHEHCTPGTRRQPQPARAAVRAARPPPLAGRATARPRHSSRPPGTHRPSCPCPTWPGTTRPCPGLPEGCTRAALRPVRALLRVSARPAAGSGSAQRARRHGWARAPSEGCSKPQSTIARSSSGFSRKSCACATLRTLLVGTASAPRRRLSSHDHGSGAP